MNNTPVRDCMSCQFEFDEDGKVGQCRRFPPKLHIIPPALQGGRSQMTPMYPPVTSGMWCGEFELKIRPFTSN